MVTRVLLIRHAVTETGGRLCGSFDVPLAPQGSVELEAVVRRLEGRVPPDALYTSTLRRAQDVASALGRAWQLPVRPVAWAREIHCGEFEGMPLEQLQRRFPDLWARNEAQSDDSFAWPGGESYRDFRNRILEGLAATVANNAGRRIAVVTHAGVIAQVLGVIRGRPASMWAPERPHPLTATEISWTNGSPRQVLTYNNRHWY